MGQLVNPRAFLIAETKVDYAAMDHALLSLHLQFVQIFFHVGFQCVQLTFH